MGLDTPVTKVGNGFHSDSKHENKHRLRIQGTAILERENQPNLTASYDYTTASANAFFEEDVDRLKFFELNKIALGMTIHKEDPSDLPIKNGKHAENGVKNGSPPGTTTLKKLTADPTSEPYLTDVIWSRMDMLNPSANKNAYIIKQYYRNGKKHSMSMPEPNGESFNNFACGFITCLSVMLFFWLVFFYIPNNDFHW